MIKITDKGYNLVYIEKTSGKKFLGKRITGVDIRLMDPETGESFHITRWHLGKNYRPDPANKKERQRRTA